MEKLQNWGYQNSETPEPIVTEFGVGDYVGDVTPRPARQNSDRRRLAVGASRQISEYHSSVVFSFPFFVTPNFAGVRRLNQKTDIYAV